MVAVTTVKPSLTNVIGTILGVRRRPGLHRLSLDLGLLDRYALDQRGLISTSSTQVLALNPTFLFCPFPASFSMRITSPLLYLGLEASPSTLSSFALLLFSMLSFKQRRSDCHIAETAHSRLPSPCFLL